MKKRMMKNAEITTRNRGLGRIESFQVVVVFFAEEGFLFREITYKTSDTNETIRKKAVEFICNPSMDRMTVNTVTTPGLRPKLNIILSKVNIVFWGKIICEMRNPGKKYAKRSEKSMPIMLTIQQHPNCRISEVYIKSTKE